MAHLIADCINIVLFVYIVADDPKGSGMYFELTMLLYFEKLGLFYCSLGGSVSAIFPCPCTLGQH